jgi:arylsulfatase A-like enzyme/Flp pilus assembly protein TadD
VLLVTIDTLRADRLETYGGSVATPSLERLAREGALFRDAVAQSPLTLPSHSSILTGTYPPYHGVRDNGRHRLPEGIDTLAEILKRAGYRTAAFVGAYPVHSRFGLAQGFDLYDEGFTRSPGTLAFSERRAEEVVAAAADWIGKQSDLYLAWVHLFDPHTPYEPPEPHASRYSDPYWGEIAYVDQELGKLFQAVGDEALIIVTADHGEGLGDHGEATHSLFVYDTTLRVPLVFKGPGIPAGTVVSDQTRTIDILPTLLELVGRGGACSACQGESLAPRLRGEKAAASPSYGETFFPRLNLGWSELKSLRHQGFKYIAAPEPELYDLGADPGETRNLAGEKPEQLEELASELRALEKSSAGPFASNAEAPANQETLQILRSLGYVSAPRPPRVSGPRPDPKHRLAVWNGISQAMEQIGRGEYGPAARGLEVLIEQNPELLLARSYLAGAYFEQARYPEAAATAEKILAEDPEDFEATLVLGRSLLRLGRMREGEGALTHAARLDPTSAEPLAELANLQLQTGTRDEARRTLARAEERDPLSPQGALVRGKLQMLEGREKEAEMSFREAMNRAPSREEPRVQLGNLLLKQRRLEEANALFRQGLSLRPESVSFKVGLGHSLALAGRLKDAIELFEAALRLDSESTAALNGLAFAHLESGQTAKGLALLRQSLQKDPGQTELKALLEKLVSR